MPTDSSDKIWIPTFFADRLCKFLPIQTLSQTPYYLGIEDIDGHDFGFVHQVRLNALIMLYLSNQEMQNISGHIHHQDKMWNGFQRLPI